MLAQLNQETRIESHRYFGFDLDRRGWLRTPERKPIVTKSSRTCMVAAYIRMGTDRPAHGRFLESNSTYVTASIGFVD